MIFPVSDRSHIGDVRRSISEQARKFGLNEADTARVSLIVSELATNLAIHAKGGFFILRRLGTDPAPGVEIISVDRGPGRSNIDQCLQDGYSTAGTAGNGLGAIRRLSDTFDIYSVAGKGTVVLSQLWPRDKTPDAAAVVGAVCEPYPGEELCGDAWSISLDGPRSVLVLADGLGHGPLANVASTEALRIARGVYQRGAADILEAIHSGVRHTRGCAVSVAEVRSDTVVFAGLGNVLGSVFTSNQPKRNMVTMNGTAGHSVRKFKEFSYPYTSGSILIVQSDGIDTHWDLSAYPGVEKRHASIIAATLYRDHRRAKDDATVIVFRKPGSN